MRPENETHGWGARDFERLAQTRAIQFCEHIERPDDIHTKTWQTIKTGNGMLIVLMEF
jgi:hypothetical protein